LIIDGRSSEEAEAYTDGRADRAATRLARRRGLRWTGLPPVEATIPAVSTTSVNQRPPETVAATAGRVATAATAKLGGVARAVATNPPPPVVAAAVVPPRAAVARSRLPRAVAVAGLVGFGALFALVKADRTKAWDAAVTLRIQARQHPALETLMRAASWPGFPPQSRLIPPAIIATMAASGLRVEALCQTAAWGSALLSTVVKSFMGRERPVAGTDLRVVAAPLGGSSFPSGHVLTYVGTYGFMAFLAATLIRQPVPRRVVTGGLVGLVALVGPSRIQQGHHWPTDVTASYLLGTSYLVGVTVLYRRLKARSAGVQP
jgi:undecaprenyl-diphosphatase